jgi:hypothetical protein
MSDLEQNISARKLSSTNSSYIAADGQSASSSWSRVSFGAYSQTVIFFV